MSKQPRVRTGLIEYFLNLYAFINYFVVSFVIIEKMHVNFKWLKQLAIEWIVYGGLYLRTQESNCDGDNLVTGLRWLKEYFSPQNPVRFNSILPPPLSILRIAMVCVYSWFV